MVKSKPSMTAEVARAGGSAHKQAQFDIIQATNPAPDDYHTWIRSPDDILTFSEAIAQNIEDYGELGDDTPDWTAEMMLAAQRDGSVVVYSSYPIEDGTFVTPSKMEAQSYAGRSSKVYSKRVSLDEVAWIETLQGQYAKVKRG